MFSNWCWRRLLRVPWTARRPNQSIIKEINPEYSLEGLMLKLKRQYFGHWCKEQIHWKRPWGWERLKAGGGGGDRGWDGRMASLTQWTWVWANSRRYWRTGRPGMLQSMGLQRVRHNWVIEQQTVTWANSSKSQDKTLYLLAAIHPLCHTGSEILTMLVIVRQWLVSGFSL